MCGCGGRRSRERSSPCCALENAALAGVGAPQTHPLSMLPACARSLSCLITAIDTPNQGVVGASADALGYPHLRHAMLQPCRLQAPASRPMQAAHSAAAGGGRPAWRFFRIPCAGGRAAGLRCRGLGDSFKVRQQFLAGCRLSAASGVLYCSRAGAHIPARNSAQNRYDRNPVALPPSYLQTGRPRLSGLTYPLSVSFRCAQEFMKAIEFENWAPRSSRTWRLGQQPQRGGEAGRQGRQPRAGPPRRCRQQQGAARLGRGTAYLHTVGLRSSKAELSACCPACRERNQRGSDPTAERAAGGRAAQQRQRSAPRGGGGGAGRDCWPAAGALFGCRPAARPAGGGCGGGSAAAGAARRGGGRQQPFHAVH